jgi:hypothetical protein
MCAAGAFGKAPQVARDARAGDGAGRKRPRCVRLGTGEERDCVDAVDRDAGDDPSLGIHVSPSSSDVDMMVVASASCETKQRSGAVPGRWSTARIGSPL